MEHDLARIYSKREDYTICVKCRAFNFGLNTKCHNCGESGFQEVTESDLDGFVKELQETYVKQGRDLDRDAIMLSVKVKIH